VAKLHNWRVVHIRAARVGTRHMTPYEGDPGLPDLILAKGGVVRLVELKSERGAFRPGQREWLDEAGEFGHLWRPSDRAAALATLSGGAP
jgi:hypothetical protein